MSYRETGTSIYRGDSPPKKLARILFYKEVRRRLGSQRFVRGKYLIIPSKDAGDAGVLHSLGVPLQNIYGIDQDYHAVAAAKYKFPDAHFVHGQFWDVFDQFPKLLGQGGLNCAFIDLCCPLREEIIKHVISVGTKARLLGFEFLCGREQGNILHSLRAKGFDETPKPRLEYLEAFRNRSHYFNIDSSWYYKSHSAAHLGKAMLACLGTVSTRKRAAASPTTVHIEWKEIRENCLRQYEIAPLRWNISKGSLAAWKAHETRGTYK